MRGMTHRAAERTTARTLATWQHAAARQRQVSLSLADMQQRQRGADAATALEAWRKYSAQQKHVADELAASAERACRRSRHKVLLAWRAAVVLRGLVWRQRQAIAVVALHAAVRAWAQEVQLRLDRHRSMSGILRRRFERILARAIRQWASTCRQKEQHKHTQQLLVARVRSKMARHTLQAVCVCWAWHCQRRRRMCALAHMLGARRRVAALTRTILLLHDYSAHVLARRGRHSQIESALGLKRKRRMLRDALAEWQRGQAFSMAGAVLEEGMQRFASSCLRATVVRPRFHFWRQRTHWRAQQQTLGEEHLRRVAAGARVAAGRWLTSTGFETWKKQHLVEVFFEGRPHRKARKLVKAWRHRVLLIVAQHDRRVQRMHVARRSSVLRRIAKLWRKHAVYCRQRVMLADRLHYSCKRRERDRLLSASINAFSLCLVLQSSFPFVPARDTTGNLQRGGGEAEVLPVGGEGTGWMPAAQKETRREGQETGEGSSDVEKDTLDERESSAVKTGVAPAAADVRRRLSNLMREYARQEMRPQGLLDDGSAAEGRQRRAVTQDASDVSSRAGKHRIHSGGKDQRGEEEAGHADPAGRQRQRSVNVLMNWYHADSFTGAGLGREMLTSSGAHALARCGGEGTPGRQSFHGVGASGRGLQRELNKARNRGAMPRVV